MAAVKYLVNCKMEQTISSLVFLAHCIVFLFDGSVNDSVQKKEWKIGVGNVQLVHDTC